MKKWAVLLCLFLLGCTYSQPVESSAAVVSAVVYEIPYESEVELRIGWLRYPLHREGIPIILENVGKVSADVRIRLTTSDIRDAEHVYCRKTDDSLLPVIRPGQQIEHTFFLENCYFPRDSNIYTGMRMVFEVVDASGEVLDRVERVMQDSIRE